MTTRIPSFTHLTDVQLVDELHTLAAHQRDATVRLIAGLMEFDARRLYLAAGCSSLFTFCTQVLRLSEHAAYGRIEAARAARQCPAVLEYLADGSATLTTINLLAPFLTGENGHSLLDAARHKSKREVEQIVAALSPSPAVPLSNRWTLVRGLPSGHYRLQFTVTAETYEKLRRAQDLMRHVVPDGSVAEVFDRAVTLLVTQLEKSRMAATKAPRPARSSVRRTRHIPASIRRTVWKRDQGRCAFVGTSGRCSETGFLQLHHLEPFAKGGVSTVENLELRCAAHNRHEARLCFGNDLVPERPDLASSRVNSVRTELRSASATRGTT